MFLHPKSHNLPEVSYLLCINPSFHEGVLSLISFPTSFIAEGNALTVGVGVGEALGVGLALALGEGVKVGVGSGVVELVGDGVGVGVGITQTSMSAENIKPFPSSAD